MTCPNGWVFFGKTCYYVPVWALFFGILGWIGRLLWETWIRQSEKSKRLKKENILEKIGDIRDEGVLIRNEGCRLNNTPEYLEWEPKCDSWTEMVVETVATLSKPYAKRFRPLGNITAQPPRHCDGWWHQNHEIKIRMMTQRIDMLDNLLEVWSAYVADFATQPPSA